MTALTNNFQRPVMIPNGGLELMKVKLAGYTNLGGGNTTEEVYKGALMMCDVNDTDGYFIPIQGTPATGDLFGGIAMDRASITSADTADGSKEISVAKNGIWGIPKGNLAITDLGASIYATDDGTGITTATAGINIGKLVKLDATYAWIDIAGAFMGEKV